MGMTRRHHRRPARLPPGTAPGTIVAPEGAPFPKISAIAYNADNLEEIAITDPGEIEPILKNGRSCGSMSTAWVRRRF
jgi:hypothetical protein